MSLPPFANLTVNLAAGLPTALTLDALGAPYNAANAVGSTVATFVNDLQTGKPDQGDRNAHRCPGRRHRRVSQWPIDAAYRFRCRRPRHNCELSVEWHSGS